MAATKSRPRNTVPKKTSERREAVFFWCVVAFLALYIRCDYVNRSGFIETSTAIQTRDPGTVPGKLPDGVRERSLILPLANLDSKWWTVYADHAMQTGDWRPRLNPLDNAPDGREIRWSSLLVWLLSGLASAISLAQSTPILPALEKAVLLVGPMELIVALSVLSILIVRRWGWAPAAFQILVVASTFPVFETMRTGEADHHGLVVMFALVSVVLLLCGGCGLVADAKSKTADSTLQNSRLSAPWFVWAGLSGAAAMWISSATFIPVLVGISLGALVAAILSRGAIPCTPGLWRTWGIAGCCGCLFFYLIENFPSHMGWRLEVNHPVYAFAWLAGAEFLTRLTQKISGGSFFRKTPVDALILAASTLAVALPVLIIAIFPAQTFWVSDKFLLQLHNETIIEFRPLSATIASLPNPVEGAFTLCFWPVFLSVCSALAFPRLVPPWRTFLAFALSPAVLMQCLALNQVRWGNIALALWSTVPVVLVAAALRDGFRPAAGRRTRTAFLVMIAPAILWFPGRTMIASLYGPTSLSDLSFQAGCSALARDVAQRLAESSPTVPTVLTGPTMSSELSYFANLRTVGTFYWENMEGLKRAASLYSEESPDALLAGLSRAGVTHIVAFSWDDYGPIYARLLQKSIGKSSPPDSLIQAMIEGRADLPQWVRPLYYPIPDGFHLENQWVKIFQVVPGQSRKDALVGQALYFLDANDPAAARRKFEEAHAIDPGDHSIDAYLKQLPPPPAGQL